MLKSISRISFELWAGVGSVSELEIWAEQELCKDSPHPDACELFNLSLYEAESQSLRLAFELEGFQPVSEQGEIWAKEILNHY